MYDQDGHLRVMQHEVADAADDGAPDGAHSSRAHDDEAGIHLRRELNDHVSRLEAPLDARRHVRHLGTTHTVRYLLRRVGSSIGCTSQQSRIRLYDCIMLYSVSCLYQHFFNWSPFYLIIIIIYHYYYYHLAESFRRSCIIIIGFD